MKSLVLNKFGKDFVFAASEIKMLVYEYYQRRILIILYTNFEGTLESIASTKHVYRKSLHKVIEDWKERLVDGEITLYQWIPKG